MPFYDLPEEELINYKPTREEPSDFDTFWKLSYFDGLNFAARAKAPALFDIGLMDDISPPSTAYAAYNHYAGEKDARVWRYNQHDGGGTFQVLEEIKFLERVLK